MNHRLNQINKLSVFTSAVFIGFFIWYFFVHVGISTYYRKYIQPQETFLDDIYYCAKRDTYRELNRQLDGDQQYVVFVGDSFVEQFPLYELFVNAKVLNRGLGCDTTAGVLKRLETTVNGIRMSKCFLMIGYNDLKYRSVEKTADNIKEILSTLRAGEKYFVSILPSIDGRYDAKIRQLNEKIKALSGDGTFKFIDCYHLFAGPDGKARAEYLYDGVHLNVDGYLRLKAALEPYVLRQRIY